MIAQTRERAASQLHTAQGLALLRHSLADELAFLSDELVSSLAGPEEGPTLLEDLESLHRSLKELESVKGYVQVVERALKLRCVYWLHALPTATNCETTVKPQSRRHASPAQ